MLSLWCKFVITGVFNKPNEESELANAEYLSDIATMTEDEVKGESEFRFH